MNTIIAVCGSGADFSDGGSPTAYKAVSRLRRYRSSSMRFWRGKKRRWWKKLTL